VDVKNWTRNEAHYFLNGRNQILFWEKEGVGKQPCVTRNEGLALMVNGKSDGNSRGDAATQIFLGLLGAFLHPHPEKAMVVGLGTGSSAGWIAQVPTVERVDVVELEPAVVQVARFCAPVNQRAVENPKIKIHLAMRGKRCSPSTTNTI
jgi:spermidine synthase